jgi:UPF0755 protein
MRLFIRLLSLFVILIVGVVLYFSYSYNKYINSAPDDKNEKRIVEIKAGESIPNIINDLESKGVILSGKKFYFFAKLNRKLDELKYGEYEFTTSMKPFEVLDKLIRGDIKKYKITIPEGYNIYQITDLISNELLINKEGFIIKCLSKESVTAFGLKGMTLEGYLFPDTYYFTKSMTTENIISKMVLNYRRNFNKHMKKRAKKLGMTEYEIVTLASIIEKETSEPSEMPTISAVFYNRLKKKMRLQSDPTVIYGIPNFNGNLTKKDLNTRTPYNTYKISGLPPSPISNPGLAALKAALNPEDVPYLYFVSKNNGTHHFSEDFEEHQGAVYKYQIKREKAPD